MLSVSPSRSEISNCYPSRDEKEDVVYTDPGFRKLVIFIAKSRKYLLKWAIFLDDKSSLYLFSPEHNLFLQVLILHGAYLETCGSIWPYDTEKTSLNLTIPTSQHNLSFAYKDILK